MVYLPWRYEAVWLAIALLAGGVGSLLVWWVVPTVNWGAAGAGWGMALLNSAAGRLINRHAVGRSGKAFIAWGLVANTLRGLTLLAICAYIIFSYPQERASFLVMTFTALFLMTGVEVANLFREQNRVGVRVE